MPQDSDDILIPCCCGSTSCAFLAHSRQVVERVKRDARTAAELGQALLARHEAYVVNAEQDRKCLLAKMEDLEQDKRHLEEKNRETVEDNRKLLDQLEALNLAASNSDAHVQSLTEHLRATEGRLERMNGFANRTDNLQNQLSRLEDEQTRLLSDLDTTKEHEKSATLRWQQAERTILNLHLQIEQLEREAKRERDRQNDEDAIAERKAALISQSWRLSDDHGPTSKTVPQAKTGNTVISHFVKDILQDNANLQLGIVELRELLQTSHDEVERLKGLVDQQVALQDPVSGTATPTLGAELEAGGTRGGTKELHVHHHYHAPSPLVESSKPLKSQIHRRPRKTRARLSSGPFTPSSAATVPRSFALPSPISAGAIMSPASVSMPRPKARWSMQSNQTGFTSSSSLPSSPSGNSVFDRVFNDAATATEFSRPTSPESNFGLSPRTGNNFDMLERSKQRRKSGQGRPSLSEALASPLEDNTSNNDISILAVEPHPPALVTHQRNAMLNDLDLILPRQSTILEEAETPPRSKQSTTLDTGGPSSPTLPDASSAPRLKRIASHESIFSVSGMDIHTLPNRPTQRFMGNRIISAPAIAASTYTSTVLTDASATAVRPSLYRKPNERGESFSRNYLSGVIGAQPEGQRSLKKKPSVGQKVGGWLGRWATSSISEEISSSSISAPPATRPTANATGSSRSINSAGKSVASQDYGKAPAVPMPVPIKRRPPGVNQAGPIFGFGPEPATPYKAILEPTMVNAEALREGLLENG